MPARLSGHVQLDRHRQGRPRREATGRCRASLHPRRAVQQGERLRRLQSVARSPAVSDAAPWSQGVGAFRAHLVGGGARRDRRAPRRHDPRVRSRGHLALHRLRQHGAHPGRVQRGAPAVERARGIAAPDDDLHDRRRGRHRLHARRQPRGDGSRDVALLPADHPLGQQHPDLEPSPLAQHHHGPSPGRPAGRDRPDPDPHGRRRRPPPGADSRDRRRAGAGPHARRARRRRGGQGFHQPAHAWLGRIPGAHPRVSAGASRRDLRPSGAGHRRSREDASPIHAPPGFA